MLDRAAEMETKPVRFWRRSRAASPPTPSAQVNKQERPGADPVKSIQQHRGVLFCHQPTVMGERVSRKVHPPFLIVLSKMKVEENVLELAKVSVEAAVRLDCVHLTRFRPVGTRGCCPAPRPSLPLRVVLCR